MKISDNIKDTNEPMSPSTKKFELLGIIIFD